MNRTTKRRQSLTLGGQSTFSVLHRSPSLPQLPKIDKDVY